MTDQPILHSLQRTLTTRLLNMIAIGGAIGTGIFLASGNAIAIAGPGGTMLAYCTTGIMVYFLMTSLGEMAAFMPSPGAFYIYGEKFVDPALGYALGWNYWYNWAITVASEITAATVIMSYWFPHSTPLLWCSLFLGALFAVNATSTQSFGEVEYWLSFTKVTVIILFIIAGAALVFGFGQHPAIGFKNWQVPGAPFHGGFAAMFSAFIIAGFSFQGTELIGIAAGESKDPAINIPRATKQIFWRILIFFILAIFIISLLIPHTAPELLSTDIEMSPFTLVFKEYGIPAAAAIMNAVILIAILSAGNSGMYAATRMLWYLASKGHVPKIFAHLNQRGIPFPALVLTTLIAALAFLASLFGNGVVYFWLVNASSLSGFIAWLGVAISHYRFRKAYLLQGRDLKALPYVAKGYPYAPLIAFFLCLLIIGGQNYKAFLAHEIDWYGILVSYINVPIFVLLYLSYKWINKTKIVNLQDCDFSTISSS